MAPPGAFFVACPTKRHFSINREGVCVMQVREKKEQGEAAAEHDHRRLGSELDLYSVSEDVGPGLILWHPKGAVVREQLENYWRREHRARGYDLVFSPHVGKSGLWETSGHLDFYQENMFAAMDVDGQAYYAKPMNCPFHMQIFGSRLRSYRELPLRYAELGTVYRYERSGVLHGLLRVRGFTQDDAHIFCRPDQLENEIVGVLSFVQEFLSVFRFDRLRYFLSTKPEKSVGNESDWETAVDALRRSLHRLELDYEIDEGGGAFYGPKLDIQVRDALGRAWQLSTVQFDFNLPERFGSSYIGPDGKEHRPFVVHRALFGSLERFFGILVEHYGGRFPLWLAPVQARVYPVAERHLGYAESIAERMRKVDLRVEVDERRDPLGARIRDGELEKIPYLLVVGDREVEADAVSVRSRDSRKPARWSVGDWLERIGDEVVQKR
jgi:threonyl-tRNA synthetase